MEKLNDVHYQFADFFEDKELQPFAYLVSKRLQEGHICIDLDEKELAKDYEALPEYFKAEFSELSPAKLIGKNEWVSTNDKVKKPFIVSNNKLYLYRYYNYETQIINSLKCFLETEKSLYADRLEKLKSLKTFITSDLQADLENKDLPEDEMVDWQLAASITGYLNNFTIVTGGPGTGKTTTVAKILALIYEAEPAARVIFAAPTGKAAQRVIESLKSNDKVPDSLKEKFGKLDPKTIHGLLGFIPDSPYFWHNSRNYLDFDVIIIDEASMIDVAMFSKLLSAVNPKCRLIVLGDKNQLASVEAGSLFGDLCNSLTKLNQMSKEQLNLINDFIVDATAKIPLAYAANTNELLFNHVVELKFSHRFDSKGGIGLFSKAIIAGDAELVKKFITENNHEAVKFDQDYKIDVFQNFAEGYKNYISEQDTKQALKNMNQLRVLCAVKQGNNGIHKVNGRIENYLKRKGYINSYSEIYSNRPVMNTRNHHDIKLFNGDVGTLRKDDNGIYRAYFLDKDNEVRSFIPGLLPGLETVFAMTIHKSQGSEYNKVLVILPDNKDNPLLTRELLYTAITRAKDEVVIQGTLEVILETIKKEVKRASGITKRINQ
jgi:exodeoxyribonuclease V alpha subunit